MSLAKENNLLKIKIAIEYEVVGHDIYHSPQYSGGG
jgi:hypothetical protein